MGGGNTSKKLTSSLLYIAMAALLFTHMIECVCLLLNYSVVVQKSSYGELV